ADVSDRRVTVTAPARLHLGFLDLEGGLGRRFGSLGLTLEGVVTRVGAARAAGARDIARGAADRAGAARGRVLDPGPCRARFGYPARPRRGRGGGAGV